MDKKKQPGAYRIAVATTDGTYIDQCFGHAEHFLILEVQENGQFLVLEDRKADPFCMGGYHLDPALEKAGDGISDCTYILAARAGEPAALAMQEKALPCFAVRAPSKMASWRCSSTKKLLTTDLRWCKIHNSFKHIKPI